MQRPDQYPAGAICALRLVRFVRGKLCALCDKQVRFVQKAVRFVRRLVRFVPCISKSLFPSIEFQVLDI